MASALVVAAVVLLFAWLIYKYYSLFRGYKHVETMFPGPATYPLLGNALEFVGDGHDAYVTGMAQMIKYRRSWRVWIGPALFINVVRPSDVEIVLSSMDILEKSEIYDNLLPWIGRGLLTSFGGRWKKHRKALTPTFHFNILNEFVSVFNNNANTLCTILAQKSGKESFDAMHYMKLVALDNICQTAMGVTIDAQHNPDSEYVSAIKTMCYVVFKRVLSPWLRPEFIFQLSREGAAQRKSLAVIHGFTKRVIDQRLKERKANPDDNSNVPDEDGKKRRVAFLDLLLNMMNDETNLTIQDVLEEVDTFMFEGHDTITSALSYIMLNLATYPKFQELAYEEQKQIFGDDSRAPTLQDLHDMKYLEMFIKESLRLYPSVPIIGRKVRADIRLDEHTVIPKGSNVLIPPIAIHRHPDIYERPNDFNPDNFCQDAATGRHPFSYIPFSAGPRNCIGMKFAMMEMKSTMSCVLRRLRVLGPVRAADTLPTAEVVLGSKNGFHVRVEHRLH